MAGKRTYLYRIESGTTIRLSRMHSGENRQWKTIWQGSDISITYNFVHNEFRLWIFSGDSPSYFTLTPRICKELIAILELSFARLKGKHRKALKPVIAIRLNKAFRTRQNCILGKVFK